jgi:hypothetical protein
MYSIPETRKETRKDFQELIPTEDVIAIISVISLNLIVHQGSDDTVTVRP